MTAFTVGLPKTQDKKGLSGARFFLERYGVSYELYELMDDFENCPVILVPSFENIDRTKLFAYLNNSGKALLCGTSEEIKNSVSIPLSLFHLIYDRLHEKYEKISKPSKLINWSLTLYNITPDLIKAPFYQQVRLIRKKIGSKRKVHTTWPADNTIDNWMQILKESLDILVPERSSVPLWPPPFKAAFVMTHDVDEKPGEEIYQITKIEKKHRILSTWNFIARSPRYKLEPSMLRELSAEGFEIGCHGLYHDRKFSSISAKERKLRVAGAKKIIEDALGKEVSGFRTPLLDRTDDLWTILAESGFSYDSSYPDVDHLTTTRYGMGVCTNLPYTTLPYLVELPVTAPQDVELFIDKRLSEKEALLFWQDKWNKVIDGRGLIVLISHPHFLKEKKRLDMYSNLLEFFTQKKDVWITTAGSIARWWQQRASYKIT
ncbi:MAG TPA: hypothetical protein DCW46_01210 [Desulfotomaculum sp.]|nr:hypothetical protein [Desulfotomaculum sp.]